MPETTTDPAERLIGLPAREDVPEEERSDYDHVAEFVRIMTEQPPWGEVIVADRPYGVPHYSALGASPGFGAAISRAGRALMKRQGQPGTFTAVDHEIIDLLLAFDSGRWQLIAGHTPLAVKAGARIEGIEALRDGREEDLTEEESLRVEFIRAVVDCSMTDELWGRMRDQLGSDQGVMEMSSFVCILLFHHRFCCAVGVPEMKREDFDAMLEGFKSGEREAPEYGGTNISTWQFDY